MQFKKGSDRVVFIFPRLGFVIKLPRFYIWIATKRFFQYATKKKYWGLLRKWFHYDVIAIGGFKRLMYKGLHDNWHEFKFFKTTRHDLLQPTYFSLFGFLNIQSYGEPRKFPFDLLLKHFMEITDGEAFNDNHHFANYRNFCFKDNKIKIIDYGSKRTQAVIQKWGKKIVAEFDLQKVVREKV